MPIMRSTVLCGSHSGDLVPYLHSSVPESGDIEILATHVSYCDGQPDPFKGSYSCDQGYTVTSLGRIRNTLLRTFKHQSIQNSLLKPMNYRHTCTG